MFGRDRRRESEGERRLAQALLDWKGRPEADERLSAAARARLLQRLATPEGAQRTVGSPFLPARRWLLAAGAPLALALLFAWWAAPRPPASPETAPGLVASKVGQEVVFTIADGRVPRRVYRSTSPSSFDPSSAVLVRSGAYVDRALTEESLVFYKVE